MTRHEGEKSKLRLVCLQGVRAWLADSDFFPDENKARLVKSRFSFLPFFTSQIETIYSVAPDHIIRIDRGEMAFIDVNARCSIGVPDLLSKDLNGGRKIELETLSEHAYYESLKEVLMPLRYVLIALLGGAGLYGIIRMVVSLTGHYIP